LQILGFVPVAVTVAACADGIETKSGAITAKITDIA
jgi:hypothetical protein